MHYLNEGNLWLFLLQLLVLLGLARGLGLLSARFGQPAITAEILVGILLGPTLLGRFAPALYHGLFPDTPVQQAMLETVAWLGILFFLLATGLETNFAVALRHGRDAVLISMADLIVPMAIAFGPCLFLSERFIPGGAPGRPLFALFLATIMTISALPVTVRIMQDLDIYRSDAGLLTVCALTINDVAGWLIFALILGMATDAGMSPLRALGILSGTILFAGLFLTVGRRLMDRAFAGMRHCGLPEPGAPLTLICLVGLLGGAITLRLGIHGLFGFFVAGIMAGEARSLSENAREMIGQTVRAVLVPLFFATIGLKLDFVRQFDWRLCLFVLVIGVIGRFVGAWVGVTLTRRFRECRNLIAAAHVPGGEMQIVVGILALECGVISEPVFVAVMVGALGSSVVLGPVMRRLVAGYRFRRLAEFLAPESVTADLSGESPGEAIRTLCELAAPRVGLTPAELAVRVLAREEEMSTAISAEVATPHARIEGLTAPVICVGRAAAGIPWPVGEGRRVRLVFLLLTPTDASDLQLRLLQAIAQLLQNEARRQELCTATDLFGVLRRHLDQYQPVALTA